VVAANRPRPPKPGPPPANKRWFQARKSPFPWEQDGLDHIRALMPQSEPFRAWATFSFTAASGRINECDLLIATLGGLYLVELKGHPGTVTNTGSTWTFRGPDRVRRIDNPLHLTNLKSKELKSQLEWAARQLHLTGVRIPRVEPAVFLSDPGLRSELDEVQRIRVYGRNDADTGLERIWDDLLGLPPQRESWRVTPEFSREVLPKLLVKIGITHSQAHLNFGDGWKLEPRALDAGPGWEDRLARREDIVREEGRVRIYLVEQQAAEEGRRTVERAARREYQVLQGITHRGIAQAVQIRQHQGGPAILFRHSYGDLRLDAYLAAHGDRIAPKTRLELVRQLAEAVRYAHNRSLYHRALSARSVYVSAREDGSRPILRIIDWQTAARESDTTGLRSMSVTTLDGDHVDRSAQAYLAPEYDQPFADPVALDIFGLGAVSYLLLTSRSPSADRAALIERLTGEGGLHPYAVADGVDDRLDQLVYEATRADWSERLPSADRFLDLLDKIEQDTTPETAAQPGSAAVDPLTAMPGQPVDAAEGDHDAPWIVERVLGTGATARALLLSRTVEDDDGAEARGERVLKVALDEDKASKLRGEARALEQVGGGAVVRLLAGPRTVAGRTVLDLEFAGARSLGTVLRSEGKLTYHQLAQYGEDLFRALDQLAAKAVRHRDLKPDNFGVYRRADREWELKLFDFSLTEVSDRDVTAGTRGYLDPFLGTSRRPVYDDHAERYAAAVTLHEMASAERPVWGDGVTDPRTTKDEHPYVAAELFEPALRDGLTAFFTRALHRDVSHRFDTLRQMKDAWLEVFRVADAAAPATTQATLGAAPATAPGGTALESEALQAARDAAAQAADLTIPLDAAGLTPRAVSVAAQFAATTVGELLNVPLYQIARARGAGAVVRKELNRRHKQWSAALGETSRAAAAPSAPTPAAQGAADPSTDNDYARLRIDELAERLVPPAASGRTTARQRVLLPVLGLPCATGTADEAADTAAPLPSWPTQVEVARRLSLTQPTVNRHHIAAVKEWAAAPWLRAVRDDLISLLESAGRVMTARELAAGLRALRGAADQPAEQLSVKALAVVRAAVEAETWIGEGRPDDEPRLAVLRRGSRTHPVVFVALESLPGTADPAPRELVDYGMKLGDAADRLAVAEPLPGRSAVIRDLRAVPQPPGMAPLADTRLVSLAAAAATSAVASPRLELYPRGLGLAKALRISQAAAGVRRGPGITVDDLLARVQARFPELDAYRPTPTHPVLEEALAEAGFPLEYDPVSRRFQPEAPAASTWLSSTGTTMTALGPAAARAGRDPQEVLAARLSAAAEQGGFLALTVRTGHLPGTAAALASAHPQQLVPVDLGGLFVAEFRAMAAELSTDWSKVLRADERFTVGSPMPGGLRSYVTRVWDRVATRLRERAAVPRSVLLLHDAGLLARYFDAGGHTLLTSLQLAARRPSDTPHGLWLLLPSEAPRSSPSLDGRTVEHIGEAEWAVLDKPFLAMLREAGQAA
jgi:serine/threonine protein kinase